jgi:hypothetical protein
VRYRGALLEVCVDADEVQVRAVDGGPVTIRVYGRDYEIDTQGIAVEQRQPVEPVRLGFPAHA